MNFSPSDFDFEFDFSSVPGFEAAES